MKKLKVGIAGCGRIGSLLEQDPLRAKPCTHAGGFAHVSSVKLVAGCDIDQERLRAFGDQWNVKHLYGNLNSMLANESLDIICIATWTELHHSMVLAAVKAGVKGIFCEKPIALNLDQAKQMVSLCKQKKIILSINHERRWEPYHLLARNIIQKGKIGEVKTIIGNALSGKPSKLPVKKYGGGGLFHDGTHLTDLLLFFGGSAKWVIGNEERPNGKKYIEETASGMIKFENGATGFIEGGGNRKYFNFELDIQGTEGRLLIGNQGRELYVTRKSKRFSGFRELERVEFPKVKQNKSPFEMAARDMVKSIQNKRQSQSTGVDGFKALQLICAIYESAQQNGKKIRIKNVFRN